MMILVAEFGVNDTIHLGARGRGCVDVVAITKAASPRWP
jgi:hypothetical protein